MLLWRKSTASPTVLPRGFVDVDDADHLGGASGVLGLKDDHVLGGVGEPRIAEAAGLQRNETRCAAPRDEEWGENEQRSR